jgi:hypothetical protein
MALSMQFAFAQEERSRVQFLMVLDQFLSCKCSRKGTKVGVQTGFDGKYSIKAKT